MVDQLEITIRLAVAALGGLAVGIEREWSGNREGNHARFAGVRTFLLIGLIGALAVVMQFDAPIAGNAILAAAALLIVVAYAGAAVVHKQRDSTTEFAAILVLASGCIAGSGRLALASALNVFTAFVLMEKSRIHSAVYSLKSEELTAGFRFAVLALVVLPLLPAGPFGPAPGIKPRELWALVLLFSGLNFAAFLARRVAGKNRGYRIAGILGGLVSSTIVTLNFSRQSRRESAAGDALAYGVIGACTVLPLRVVILTMLLNRPVGQASLIYLLIPFLAGFLFLSLFGKPSDAGSDENVLPRNPLRLIPAIQMVVAFQLGLYAIQWVSVNLGATGIFTTAALLGAGDVDTLIFSISRQSALTPEIAAQALTFGVLVNTLLKMTLALAIGTGRYRRITASALGMIALTTISGLVFSMVAG